MVLLATFQGQTDSFECCAQVVEVVGNDHLPGDTRQSVFLSAQVVVRHSIREEFIDLSLLPVHESLPSNNSYFVA